MKNLRKRWSRAAWMMLLLAPFCVSAQWKHVPDNKVIPGHPRIMLLAGEEERVKDNIAADPAWAEIHQAILDECGKITALPELQRIVTGRRLLSVSREALRRIFYLSYAYRMTGEEAYVKKAEKEMLAIAAFADWNPSNFLDVAEMTMAMSIGYDWLFNALPWASKQRIAYAIFQKGLDPSMNSVYAWYLTAAHNWNQVCNAGITFGALAIYEEIPQLAKSHIDRAVESIKLPMKD